MLLRLGAAAVVALVFVSQAAAWGGSTHQWISLQALDRGAAKHPALAALRAHPRRLAAFLGASMAPDFTVSLVIPAWKYQAHKHMHTAAFAEALVDAAGHDPEAVAQALGWRAHQVQDESGANGQDSYPSRKLTLRPKPIRWRSHMANELLLDLLVRGEPDAPRAPLRVPIELLREVFRQVPLVDPAAEVILTASALSNHRLSFAFQAFVGNALFDGLLLALPQTFLDSLGAFFLDARTGDRPGQGLDPATQATTAALLTLLAAHPQAVAALLTDRKTGRAPVPDSRQPAVVAASALAIERIGGSVDWGRWLAAARARKQLPKNAVLDFFCGLLQTRVSTFPAFLDEFERTWRTPRTPKTSGR